MAMLLLSVFLLVWLFEAQGRFFNALKYRAAVLAGSVVSVRGLREFAYILENATYDHILALRHWRMPSAAVQVDSLRVPFALTDVRLKNSAAVEALETLRFNYCSSVRCMVTVVRNINLDTLKLALKNDWLNLSDTRSLPESNKV